jgi:predicted transcriptional regulator
MKNLTKTEEIIYDYMKSYSKEKGQCPNLREISKFISKSHNTAKYHVNKLKEKGLVKSIHAKTRFGVWTYILL